MGGPRPLTHLSSPVKYALERGWLVQTSCGYEPTVAGLLTGDELRDQAGYPRYFQPWTEEMHGICTSPSNLLPDESVPLYFVLDRLRRWEAAGTTNEAAVDGGYVYVLLAKPGYFAKFPALRFCVRFIEECVLEGLIACGTDLTITSAGRSTLGGLDEDIDDFFG